MVFLCRQRILLVALCSSSMIMCRMVYAFQHSSSRRWRVPSSLVGYLQLQHENPEMRVMESLLRMTFVDGEDAGNSVGGGKRMRMQKSSKRQQRSSARAVLIRSRTDSEIESKEIRKKRQKQYEQIRNSSSDGNVPSLWSFESLFPDPVMDTVQIKRDLEETSLYKNEEKEKYLKEKIKIQQASDIENELRSREFVLLQEERRNKFMEKLTNESKSNNVTDSSIEFVNQDSPDIIENITSFTEKVKVDWTLSRKVEDSMYGIRRDPISGQTFDDTSLMGGEGAIKFRNGVRLGKALRVNLDRLNYFAKTEMRRNKLDEAEELYAEALLTDPFDGRAYLGLSRISQRKRDFPAARKYLKMGISRMPNNPYLLQALGTLEERVGNLAEAEACYISSVRARSSHAAAWVSLAQLRTRKLRQSPDAGRLCFQTAEREMVRAGLPPSSYVYTSWASLEYKQAGNYKLAKSLFEKALNIDPRCSAAWLQLGVMEADKGNWDDAQKCFEAVLKFDKRNSRVLQAYAIAESKRPNGKSREAIELFERALNAKPNDAGVYQAYGLYVAELGDIEMARELFRRGTSVGKRHAPLWQAWGVLETNYGNPDDARDVFQQGIWACAQLGGSQSGGKRCARLWQAWGVLEAREGEYACARRCFSRTLDAENNNVAAVTAWAFMEEAIGNQADARSIFERALKQLPPSSPDRITLWNSYEQLEAQAGNYDSATIIHQRCLRQTVILQESMSISEPIIGEDILQNEKTMADDVSVDEVLMNDQVELIARWKEKKEIKFFSFQDEDDVWMNNGLIEGKVPDYKMKKNKDRKRSPNQANSR